MKDILLKMEDNFFVKKIFKKKLGWDNNLSEEVQLKERSEYIESQKKVGPLVIQDNRSFELPNTITDRLDNISISKKLIPNYELVREVEKRKRRDRILGVDERIKKHKELASKGVREWRFAKAFDGDDERELPNYDEIYTLIKDIDDIIARSFIAATYLCAGRISEVLSMRKKDISMKSFNVNGKSVKSVVFHIINRKNRKHHTKKIPISLEKEGHFFMLMYNYLRLLRSEEKVFPFSSRHGRDLCYKYLFMNPHQIRHIRITHLITVFNMNDEKIKRIAGWTDTRPLGKYAHLRVGDLVEGYY